MPHDQMNDRHLPTTPERARISRLLAWRSGLALLSFLPMSVMVFALAWRGDSDWPLIIVAACVLLVMLGLLAYVSFGLRCPRCATWTGVAVDRCASCGLKFEMRKEPAVGPARGH
jgi:protein-S-isoprenylcysteine O-methyltransferase Ste14